jgi:hypothetical protein
MSWGFIFRLRQYHGAPMLTANIGHPCRTSAQAPAHRASLGGKEASVTETVEPMQARIDRQQIWRGRALGRPAAGAAQVGSAAHRGAPGGWCPDRARAGGTTLMSGLAHADIKRMRDQLFFEAQNAPAG